MLISLSGLPGTGKTTVASLAAGGIERGLLTDRFESSDRCVERVLRSKALDTKSGKAVAADNLALGRTVIADCVNPWPLTRDAWQQVGQHRHVRVTASAPNGNCRFS